MNAPIDPDTVALLDAYSPPPGVAPDWDDVLRRTPLGRRRQPRRWALRGGAVAAVAAIVSGAALFWPQSQSSIVQQALGAIGSGRVLHAVLQTQIGAQLVDIRSGARTSISGTTELWSDDRLGTVEQMRFRGTKAAAVYFPTPKQLGLRVVSVNRPVALLGSYRVALRRGQLRVAGHGRLFGVDVDWLEGQPFVLVDATSGAGRPARMRIAIDRRTFKPVLIEVFAGGHRLSARRILSITTTTVAGSPLAHPQRSDASLLASIPATDTPSTTLAAAAQTMRKAPVVPPRMLEGLRRSWIGQPLYLVGKHFPPAHEPAGVVLFYGSTLNYGQPDYRRRYIAINEFPDLDPVFTVQGVGWFPTGHKAVASGGKLTFQHHGLYIQVQASTRTLAFAAARAVMRN